MSQEERGPRESGRGEPDGDEAGCGEPDRAASVQRRADLRRAAFRESRGPESAMPPDRTNRPICDLCGAPMVEVHCKLICRKCGYKRDCSDP